MIKWFSLALVIVVLDQLTKYCVVETLSLNQSIPVFAGFNLTLLHNTGAAFSFLSQAGGWQRWFLFGLSGVISFAIAVWMWRLPVDRRFLLLALALLLGGGLGNMVDRFLFGYVIDFIEVSLPFLPWRLFNPWPVFNIADSAISIGVVMLIIDAFFFNETPVS